MAHTSISEVPVSKDSRHDRETHAETTPPVVHEEINASVCGTSHGLLKGTGSSYSNESKQSSYGSFPGLNVAGRLGLNGRGVTWDNRWVVLIAALWLQVRETCL